MSRPRPEVFAILADAKENPDEDRLRLVLADWLEEHGDALDQARAELIRCQLARADQAAARRARWLQQNFGPKWLGPLAEWLTAWSWRRGLLSACVEAASLRGSGLARLAASETWAWVDEVYVFGAAEADFPRLGKCELFSAVTSLGFRRVTLGQAGSAALARLPWAVRLRHLDLSFCYPTLGGVAALADSPLLAGLWGLDLSGCQLTPACVARLFAPDAAPFPGLRSLVLYGNPLGDEAMRGVQAVRPGLRSLDLRACHVGEAGGRALARWAGLASLRELNLADNQLGPGAAEALASSPHLGAVENLVLWGNALGDGAGRLRERFGERVRLSP